jgi:hypothetical protein
MCVDFIDLNKTYPIDKFPLPKIDRLVDSMIEFEFLSSLDTSLGYN